MTLIEAVAAIAVLAVAIPPLVALFREVAAHSASDTYQGVAVTLAESLMEEVVSKDFEDPDEVVGSFGTEEGSRSSYDDVDDYDGLSNSPPQRLDGTLLDDYGGFSRSVTVDNVTPADPDPTTPATDGSTEYKRIRVTVAWTGGAGGELSLATLRTNAYGKSPLDDAASADTAAKKDSKKFELDLVSISAVGAVLESFELSADVGTEMAKKLKLDGKEIWKEDAGVALPTGVLALNRGNTNDRTVDAGGSPTLECEFLAEPSGTVDYTLILHYTNRIRSVLSFSIVWT